MGAWTENKQCSPLGAAGLLHASPALPPEKSSTRQRTRLDCVSCDRVLFAFLTFLSPGRARIPCESVRTTSGTKRRAEQLGIFQSWSCLGHNSAMEEPHRATQRAFSARRRAYPG